MHDVLHSAAACESKNFRKSEKSEYRHETERLPSMVQPYMENIAITHPHTLARLRPEALLYLEQTSHGAYSVSRSVLHFD